MNKILAFAKDHPYEVGGGVFVIGLIFLFAYRHFHKPAQSGMSEAAQIKLAQIQAGVAETAARDQAAPGLAAARAQTASARTAANASTRQAQIQGITDRNAANYNYRSSIYGDKTGYETQKYDDDTAFRLAENQAWVANQANYDKLVSEGYGSPASVRLNALNSDQQEQLLNRLYG